MSNAEDIKKYYKQLLMDGQLHSREELFLFARKNNKNYTDGMLSSALKTLIEKDIQYIQVERGIYQFVKTDTISQYIEIFKNTQKQLNNVSVNPFKFIEELDNEGKEKLKLVENCIKILNNTIDDLQND